MISVSIVIPIYKVEEYILDCLKSVANQTYSGPVECICIDDCTPDNSACLVEQFIRDYSGSIRFVLLRHERNRGVSAARNTGIDSSTGDYILFLDGDDELTDDCIEKLASPLEKHAYSFVVSDFDIIPDGSKKIYEQKLDDGKVFWGEEVIDSFSRGLWFQMPTNRLLNLGWIRKNELRFKEGLYAEDNLWCFETAAVAESMAMVSSPTYRHYIREGSLANLQNSGNKLREAYIQIIDYMRDFIKEHELTNNFNVYNHYQAFSRVSIVKVYENGGDDRAKTLYENWRSSGLYSKLRILRFASKSLRSFVRDLHYFLPCKLGFKYMVKTEKLK